jgi:hypothetical protein
MKLNELRDRIRIERIEPLRDGARFKVLAPSRVRVYRDGEWLDDPEVIYERKLGEIEKSEKVKAEQKKSGKKK